MEEMVGESLGEYQIIEDIGRGGMAVVYRAFQPKLERYVALKILPPWLATDSTFVTRFHQEAIAAANLSHANIVTIHDVEEERGVHFIVMQFLKGHPLSQLLSEGKPLPFARALNIAQQVADALDYAHGHAFVHRDIKPGNIMISPDDHATVTDFGLVKASAGTSLTRTGTIVGTPEYMSPEQCQGNEADRRSDIYSFGIVLYQMLTGKVPFAGANPASILHMHIHRQPTSPRRLNNALPREAESVLYRALAKVPYERYSSAAEIVASLEATLPQEEAEEVQPESTEPAPVSAKLREVPAAPAEEAPAPEQIEDAPRLRTLEGHSEWVRSVSFSPDGATLASGSDDKTVVLWDVETSRQLRTLKAHTGVVYDVAFSPDGATLASASWDKSVILWDVSTGRPLRTLEGHMAGVNSVAISPNGSVLASGADDRTVILWDVCTGRQLRTLEEHTGVVYGVEFSPDGQTLASGSWDRTVILWGLRNFQPLITLERYAGPLLGMAFSPDGATLASGSDEGIVILWDARRGRRVRTLKGHQHAVRGVAFSPDGVTLASGSDDRTVILWDTESGEQVDILEGHGELVTAVAFSPDGDTLASGSFDRLLMLWRVERRARPKRSRMLRVFSRRK